MGLLTVQAFPGRASLELLLPPELFGTFPVGPLPLTVFPGSAPLRSFGPLRFPLGRVPVFTPFGPVTLLVLPGRPPVGSLTSSSFGRLPGVTQSGPEIPLAIPESPSLEFLNPRRPPFGNVPVLSRIESVRAGWSPS